MRLLYRLVVLCLLAPSLARAQTPGIEHQPAACATVDRFPRLEARFTPAETVAAARVVFQGLTADWYSVAMKPEGAVFAGVLPKPNKSLKTFRYYIEVTDKAMGTNRTAEHSTAVVESASACQGKLMAGALGSASVILQGPAGLAALPAGFASTGVVTGSAAGSSAGAAGAAAAGGGGIGATALVLGGVAVVGGAAAVVVAKGEDSGDSDTSESSSRYQVSFLPSPPGIELTVCGTGSTSISFNAQGVTADRSGAFNEIWSPTTPVLRAVGQVTATTFSASLSCTNGARTGSISATGSNGSYSGTFEFGPSRGQVTVTKS